MRNSRTLIVGLILVVLAGLVAWRLFKPVAVAEQFTVASAGPVAAERDTPSGGPSPREPIREAVSHTTLTSVAMPAQDVGARLDMRSIKACHDALLNKKALEYQINCDNIPAEQTSSLSFCRNQQAQAAQLANEAEAAAASCPQELLTASSYYEATKTLALRGDIPAQRCFIQGYFASAAQEGEESRMTKEQVAEYIGLAKKFIDEALERGDWSIVRWLARLRLGLQDGMLRTAYPFGSEHPETAFRMNFLLMLGNQQAPEKNIDMHQLVEGWKDGKSLSSKQIREGEHWAHDMYDQHFNGSTEGASVSTNLCANP